MDLSSAIRRLSTMSKSSLDQDSESVRVVETVLPSQSGRKSPALAGKPRQPHAMRSATHSAAAREGRDRSPGPSRSLPANGPSYMRPLHRPSPTAGRAEPQIRPHSAGAEREKTPARASHSPFRMSPGEVDRVVQRLHSRSPGYVPRVLTSATVPLTSPQRRAQHAGRTMRQVCILRPARHRTAYAGW